MELPVTLPDPPSFCLPQTDAQGRAFVLVTRAGTEPVMHPCRDKEEACFWARQWMRRERLARLEGSLFDQAWIAPRSDH